MLRSRLRCLSPPLAILVGVILGLTLSSLLHHPSSSSLSSLSSSRTLSDPMLLDDVANMRDRIRELEEQLRTALGSSDRAATSSRRNIRAPGEPSTGLLPPPVAPLVLTDPAAFIAEHPDSNPAPVRVCLVTSAFSGPTLNGGIATAFFSLAKHMVASRQPGGRNREFKVTVLYAAHPYYAVGNAEKWRETFAAAGIDFVPLPEPETKFYGAKLVIRSYRVFEYLRTHENEFDVISYHDHMGNGYFAALAKHQNLAFANTMLVVQGHSTMRWADIGNHRPPKDHNSLAYYFMEQKSIEYADARVSPSQYYLEWMRDEGRYDLSHGLSFVVQNTLFPLAADEQIVKLHKSRHFVFFGRLEVRKGLLIFCDALDQLVADSQTSGEQALPKTVTFLGPDTSIDGERAVSILRKRMDQGKWPFKVAIELAFDSFRALKYIKDHNAIAVLPTLGDNSPYVVMELIAHNLPMITTDAGGGEELIAKDTGFAHEPVVVPAGDAVALAASMSYAMASGIHNVHMSSSFTQTRDTYLQLFHAFRALSIKRRANRADHPPGGRVTVGITSHNRPDSLVATVNSILHQTYPSRLIRVVIVDDASDHPLMNATFADISNKLAKAGIQYQLVQMPKHTFVAESRNLIFQMAVESDSDYACLMVCALERGSGGGCGTFG